MTFVMNLMKKRIGNQRGVTLVELLAVIVILGIIAAVAVPTVLNSMDDAQTNSDAQSEAIVLDAAQRFFLDNKVKQDKVARVTFTDLVNGGYLLEIPSIKTSSTTDGETLADGITKTAAGAYSFTTGTVTDVDNS